ncbi:MAG: histidinol-phosphate transaminase [Dehalococcoidia bacterium]
MTSSSDLDRGVERLFRPELAALEAYSPILPLEVLSEQSAIPAEGIIKLDGNENPYGCSPQVGRALEAYPFYHVYPDPEQRELRKAVGAYCGLGADHIVMGSGSDELIDLILRLFLEPGDKVINCTPTFGMYPFSTGVCGGRVVDVPRDQSYGVDIDGVKAALDKRTKIAFLASPNNPTGNITPQPHIRELVDAGVVVVVDEAYYEFSGVTVAPLVADYDNLIVLRSFSKWAGLAGLRAGYGIFPPQIARHLTKIKPPYNVNVAAQVAVKASLADIAYLQGTLRAMIAERERLFSRLSELGFLKPYPSQANFILCSVVDGEAQKLHRGLQQVGIFVRYFDTPQLRSCLRISVGRPEHTDALISALTKLREG